MKQPEVLITRDQIREKVAELAAQIRDDYRDRNPVLVGVLKGSFIFMSDIIRALDIPVCIDFISVSSYGREMESSGEITLLQDLRTPVEGREVLLIEDIVDTGLCVDFVFQKLQQKKPASVKVCSLLDKPSRRIEPVKIDYLGFTVPDRFVVGYGLDFDEQYRYLPDICFLRNNKEKTQCDG